MTIKFKCSNPDCGKTMSTPDSTAGKRARCPSCGQVQTIPSPAEPTAAQQPAASSRRPDKPRDVETPTDRGDQGGQEMNTCVVCGTTYPRGQACPRCHPQAYAPRFGGPGGSKWVTIGAVVAVFALLMVGAYFVIKGLATTGEQYGKALHGAQEKASDVACALQLSNIYQSIQADTIANDGQFPASLSAYYTPRELHCPSKDGPAYVYVPGQDQSMPASNVLIYETEPVHEGKCSVLRLNGRVELLSPAQLQAALEATRQSMAAHGSGTAR